MKLITTVPHIYAILIVTTVSILADESSSRSFSEPIRVESANNGTTSSVTVNTKPPTTARYITTEHTNCNLTTITLPVTTHALTTESEATPHTLTTENVATTNILTTENVTPTTHTLTTKNVATTESLASTTTHALTTENVTSAVPVTPVPDEPPIHIFLVKGDNGTCILLQCGIQFKIPYTKSDKQVLQKTIGVPDGVSFNGSCNQPNDTQQIEIIFYDGWDLRLIFSKDVNLNKDRFYLSEIKLSANLTRELFPDIESPKYIQNMSNVFGTDTIAASEDGSYACTEKSAFALQDGFIMNTYNLQYAAFQTNITGFSNSDLTKCSPDTEVVSYIPIAVGSALGGLILIVLLAYIIGRRCESASKYNMS